MNGHTRFGEDFAFIDNVQDDRSQWQSTVKPGYLTPVQKKARGKQAACRTRSKVLRECPRLMKSPDLLNVGGRSGQQRETGSICPLTEIQAGTAVRIRELAASVETSQRLREIGFCEQQVIHLLAHHGNVICQVRNCRMGIGATLARSILVEELPCQRLR